MGELVTEPVTPSSPRPVRRPLLTQSWRELAFLHWPVDPSRVSGLLPPGTRPDTLGGVTYVGLVAFRVPWTNALRGARLPHAGTFAETNVRLYSVDGEGRRGVVFRSLEASRLLFALTARKTLHMPYMWASMRADRDGDVLTYTSRRRWPGPRGTRSRIAIRTGRPIAEPTALQRFLTARWGLHVARRGRTLHLPNEHPRWSLHTAELVDLEDELVAAAGLPAPTGHPISVLYAPGVVAKFGRPTTIRQSDGGLSDQGPRGSGPDNRR